MSDNMHEWLRARAERRKEWGGSLWLSITIHEAEQLVQEYEELEQRTEKEAIEAYFARVADLWPEGKKL
jgi:hypothetical protein